MVVLTGVPIMGDSNKLLQLGTVVEWGIWRISFTIPLNDMMVLV